ncbi:MAG TPA: acyl-CoA dehydratase activase [Bacillota bacterium]|jgi:predicted CoA-substrate-specific enzyme activase|nr:acyl-CoA dehydratase activase [Bacillota bacterium]HQE10934.1 acyl-CoA dehydratase activase [Bacillota bacterium]
MIGYICKYTPVELLCAFGEQPELLNTEVTDFAYADRLAHPNLCFQAKAFLEHSREVEKILLTSCCDSLRRVYDLLYHQGKHEFLYTLDLPHEDRNCARTLLTEELIRLAGAYGQKYKTVFNKDLFLAACQKAARTFPDRPFLAVLGARVSRELFSAIAEHAAKAGYPVADLTCSGHRCLESPPPEARTMDFPTLMSWYAGALLRQIPCLRMSKIAGRRALWEHENLRGIIYNTVKFCDYYHFEYGELRKETAIPILKIESDFTPQARGQLATRLEAFTESLGPQTGKGRAANGRKQLYAGIDSGSTTTNVVVLNENREIVASATVRTGAKARRGAQAALEIVCRQLGVDLDDFAGIVATGYGRESIGAATGTRTEISCHAKGARFLHPEVRTLIDIGGQDSKVICLDEEGKITNFIMNDKCAAGTGRFLEMMAATLELDLEAMSTRGLEWQEDLTISSMCTVFAESEVISLIAENHRTADIIHGLNKAVAARTAALVSRAGGKAPYMMSGGVAHNTGVVRELEKRLVGKVFIPEAPELCGALGAALFALEG